MALNYTQSIGRNSYTSHKVIWGDGNSLSIGSFCSIASHVIFCLGGNHDTKAVTTYPLTSKKRYSNGDIKVGNDVWIGFGAFVLSGSVIGDGAIIGAMAVVSGEIPPYSVCAGNPAKVIRKRFSDSIVERLLRVKWWEWGDDIVKRYSALLQSNDVEEFLRRAECEEMR